MATTPVKQRVQKHRNALRMAGLRPVQIWVPDTRRPDFAEECRRQSLLVAQADSADAAMQQFMDNALADVDGWIREHSSVTVLPITGTLVVAPLLRVTIQPTAENDLQKPSQVMVDKAMTVKRERVGPVFGRIDADTLVEVERCLAVFLGLAK